MTDPTQAPSKELDELAGRIMQEHDRAGVVRVLSEHIRPLETSNSSLDWNSLAASIEKARECLCDPTRAHVDEAMRLLSEAIRLRDSMAVRAHRDVPDVEAKGLLADRRAAHEPPAALKYFATPLRFVEPADDSDRLGARIVDASGNMVAQLFWPCHPKDETEAAEQETYALGRAMAAAKSFTPMDREALRAKIVSDPDETSIGAGSAQPPVVGCSTPTPVCTCWFMGAGDLRPDHSPDCALKQQQQAPVRRTVVYCPDGADACRCDCSNECKRLGLTKPAALPCVWRTGCKHPAVCAKHECCVPGGEQTSQGEHLE